MKVESKKRRIQNGYKEIDVEIISYTKNPAKIMWDMMKQSRQVLHDFEYSEDNGYIQLSIQKVLDDALNTGVVPVPANTIQVQVVFKNISRVNLAQLITGGLSWRFNGVDQVLDNVTSNVILPLTIRNSAYRERAEKLIEDSQKLYYDMTKNDISFYDARYLLLYGQTANMSASFTIPQLIAGSKQSYNGELDEMNYTFRVLIRNLMEAVKKDLDMDDLDKKIYKHLFYHCDIFGVPKKDATYFDKMLDRFVREDYQSKERAHLETGANNQELRRLYNIDHSLLCPIEREALEKKCNDKYKKLSERIEEEKENMGKSKKENKKGN